MESIGEQRFHVGRLPWQNQNRTNDSTPKVVKADSLGLQWPLLRLNPEQLADLHGQETVEVRYDLKEKSLTPEWDCCYLETTLQAVVDWILAKSGTQGQSQIGSLDRQKHWVYVDYKYLPEVVPRDSPLFSMMDWKDLGLDISPQETVLWLGSEGAGTAAHYDAYGTNVVVQLYGRKRWLLFPPSATKHLHPSRVPFEESSCYSRLSPAQLEASAAQLPGSMELTLQPGDILFVPKHWWHQVSCVTPALSVNVWLPDAGDAAQRALEALCRALVATFAALMSTPSTPGLQEPPFQQKGPEKGKRVADLQPRDAGQDGSITPLALCSTRQERVESAQLVSRESELKGNQPKAERELSGDRARGALPAGVGTRSVRPRIGSPDASCLPQSTRYAEDLNNHGGEHGPGKMQRCEGECGVCGDAPRETGRGSQTNKYIVRYDAGGQADDDGTQRGTDVSGVAGTDYGAQCGYKSVTATTGWFVPGEDIPNDPLSAFHDFRQALVAARKQGLDEPTGGWQSMEAARKCKSTRESGTLGEGSVGLELPQIGFQLLQGTWAGGFEDSMSDEALLQAVARAVTRPHILQEVLKALGDELLPDGAEADDSWQERVQAQWRTTHNLHQ